VKRGNKKKKKKGKEVREAPPLIILHIPQFRSFSNMFGLSINVVDNSNDNDFISHTCGYKDS